MQQKINPICIPIVEDCYFSNRNSIRPIEEFRNYLVFTIGEVVNMLWEIRWLWNSLGILPDVCLENSWLCLENSWFWLIWQSSKKSNQNAHFCHLATIIFTIQEHIENFLLNR